MKLSELRQIIKEELISEAKKSKEGLPFALLFLASLISSSLIICLNSDNFILECVECTVRI